MIIGNSTNSTFGYPAKSLKQDATLSTATASVPTPTTPSPKGSIKDEYTPSSAVATGKSVGSLTGNAPTVSQLEAILGDFLKKHSSASYRLAALNIDGDGNFVASESTRFFLNARSDVNEKEKQNLVDELNRMSVGGQSLGEAFLQAYATEFDVDLDAARAKGQEIGGLHFDFQYGLTEKPEFVSTSTNRILAIGDTCYWFNDNESVQGDDKKLSASISQNKGILGSLQTKAQDSNNKTSDSETFGLASFLTNMLKAHSPTSISTR